MIPESATISYSQHVAAGDGEQEVGHRSVLRVVVDARPRDLPDQRIGDEDPKPSGSRVLYQENIYDGIVEADAKGEAVVQLPDYFEALNNEVRYQLTALGASAAGLYVKREIQNGEFTIAGANSRQRISWQVTGVRKDPFALANPLIVESDKGRDRGFYRHPEVYNLPLSKRIGYKEPRQRKARPTPAKAAIGKRA